MRDAKNVLVIGTGTIGEPLIGLLCHFRDQLGIDNVWAHKKTALVSDRSKIADLMRRGARLTVEASEREAFTRIGLEPGADFEEALAAATVVVDCTPQGNAMKKDRFPRYEDTVRLFVAQGSQFGFGMPYARGINDSVLETSGQNYVQVVSCNTHNLAVLLSTLALADGGPENLREGRFVCMRRANDLSQESGYCPSPEVGAHVDPRFGSHHARDAWHLFNSLGHDLNLFSSELRLNTQLMHVLQFHLKVDRPTTVENLLTRIEANDRLALTWKQSVANIFSFGRDHGFFGRLLNQAVIPRQSLHVSEDGRSITGYSFTPQDGNSLLSTVSAVVWALYPETYDRIIQCLRPFFFNEI